MPIYEMKTLARVLDDTLGAERLIAALSVVFALLATAIAALGLYGVVSFSVERRTKEIGMRTALGASPASVMWLVMREVLSLFGLGLIAGIPCAIVLTQYATPQLFGAAPSDAWVASAAVATLAVVAIVAGALPAHRARTLDPLVALRRE